MNIVDIIEDLVLTSDFTVKALEVEEISPNTWKVTLCSMGYINKCTPLTQNGNDYSALEIGDGYIIITGSVAPVYGSIEIKSPQFVHGTYTDTGQAIGLMSRAGVSNNIIVHFTSTPLKIKKMYSGKKVFKSTVSVQLLLLASNDIRNWKPDEHYDQCINQMNNLCNSVIANIHNKRELKQVSDIDQVNVINIGIDQTKKGTEKNLFGVPYSGVVVSFDLELLGSSACCC